MLRALLASVAAVGALAGSAVTVQASVPPAPPTSAPDVDQHGPTIKDAYSNCFPIGTAGDIPGNYTDAELSLVKENFNVVTPENCMKPGPVHPAEDIWRFDRPDALVTWCEQNHLLIHGHTLVWHNQTGSWFFKGDKEIVTRL